MMVRGYRRKYRKRQKYIMIFLVVGTFCFFSVGYAAFSSNFLIAGKGTIISKPITIDELKLKEVETGDGLYKDPVESRRYVYRGITPSNFIWLDLNDNKAKTSNEVYRIISIENDNTLKVVAHNPTATGAFDTENARYSSTSTDYCTSTYGCNIWGSKTTTLDTSGNTVTKMAKTLGGTLYNLPTEESSLNKYLNTTFLNSINTNFLSKIETHLFNVGTLKQVEGQTLETDISQEQAYKWRGKIGLMSPTDYVKASTNEACTSVTVYYNDAACYNYSTNHNYLFKAVHEWLMSPASGSQDYVWRINYNQYITSSRAYNDSYYYRPAFYLNSEIRLKGSGTEAKPYEIE